MARLSPCLTALLWKNLRHGFLVILKLWQLLIQACLRTSARKRIIEIQMLSVAGHGKPWKGFYSVRDTLAADFPRSK